MNSNQHTIAPRCSVIILNWNGAAWLSKFLPSVVAHTPASLANIIVADNGSTDNSLNVLRQFPTVEVIPLDRNYGFAEGYNRAIAQVQTQYVVLLNSDVEVTSDWLTPLINYMDTHESVAACQPKILAHSTINQPIHQFEHAGAAGGLIDHLGYPFCRGRRLKSVENDTHQYDSSDNLFWASGACMICRTDLYIFEGGLDPLFFAHMEEIDLCWRLQLRGHRIACCTRSQVFHVGGGSLGYDNPQKTFLNFRNNLLMLYKNLPTSRLHRVLFVRFWLDYLAAAQMLLTLHPQNALAVAKARLSFLKLRKQYRNFRRQNLKTARNPYPQSISHSTLLIDYYLRRKK